MAICLFFILLLLFILLSLFPRILFVKLEGMYIILLFSILYVNVSNSFLKGFVFVFAVLMLLNTFRPEVSLRFLRDHLYHNGNVVQAERKEELLTGGS